MKHQSWMMWKWEQETCFPHGTWGMAGMAIIVNAKHFSRSIWPTLQLSECCPGTGTTCQPSWWPCPAWLHLDGDLFQVYPWWRIVPMRIQLSQLSMSWGVIIPRIHDFLVVSLGSLGIGPGRSRPNTSWSRLPRAAACCVVVGNMAAQRRPSGDRSLNLQMMESKNPMRSPKVVFGWHVEPQVSLCNYLQYLYTILCSWRSRLLHV